MMDQVLVNNRLGHAYIFEGMVGSGQEDMAYIWQLLRCLNPADRGYPGHVTIVVGYCPLTIRMFLFNRAGIPLKLTRREI